MSKKSRKLVGKPTGRVTKAGRPVLKTPEGEERSEYSTTIKLDNGKYINIPSIHNGKYYTEDELKNAVQNNRMIPTSEHDSVEEAIEAAKKRSKTLKQGGLLKAHQGTIVNGQIVYPQTSQAPSDPNPIANPFLTDPNTIPPQKMPTSTGGDMVKLPEFTKNDMGDPAVDFSTVSTPLQGGMTQAQLEAEGKASQPIGLLGENIAKGLGGEGVANPTEGKLGFGGGQLFPTQGIPVNTAQPIMNQQTLLDFFNQSRAKQLEQQQKAFINNKYSQSDYFKNMQEQRKKALDSFQQSDAFKEYQGSMKKLDLETEMGYEEAKKDLLQQLNPMPFLSIGNAMNFNKGGVAMEEQMELFDEGGMKDDGGEKDPVSGNDIPSGSMAKEVRDDVPAMVSEGEFIFPADVTRFIGLNNLMEMRQDAKMGLKKMEAMGQLGNPEDADLPDDIPFDAADILIMSDMEEEEVEKKAQGGVFGYQEGTAGPEAADKYFNIQKEANKQYAKTYAYYKNDAGDMKAILTDYRGQPLEPVPSGYKLMLNEDGSPVTKKPEKAPDDIEATQPAPAEQTSNNEREAEPDPMYSSEYLADKFKGDVITDKNGNPISMTEQGYNAVLTSAQRLGLSANDYFSLPMSARMELAGEEMKALFGGTADTKKASDVLRQVQSGEWKGGSGFLSSLFGGIFDKITGLFSPDGATDEQAIQSLDKAKSEITPTTSDGVTPVTQDMYDKAGIYQGYSATSKRGDGMYTPSTKSRTESFKPNIGYETASGRSKVQGSLASPTSRTRTNTGASSEGFRASDPNKSDFTRDEDKRGSYSSQGKQKDAIDRTAARNISKQKDKQKEKESRAYGGSGSLASGKFGNKGMLIAKPPTTKKPTPKRKTLVQKKS